jgi:hypothetical protein
VSTAIDTPHDLDGCSVVKKVEDTKCIKKKNGGRHLSNLYLKMGIIFFKETRVRSFFRMAKNVLL